MSSIIIDNCNNTSLPPLLLPAVVHHDERNTYLNKLSASNFKQDKSVSGPNLISNSNSWSKPSANYTTAKTAVLLTPPNSNIHSSTATANSSLDNLASLASVAAATNNVALPRDTIGSSYNSHQHSLIHDCLQRKRSNSCADDESLAPPVAFKKRGRKNLRKNSMRMSSNTSFTLSSAVSSNTTSSTTSRSSSRSKSPLSRAQSVSNSPSSVEEDAGVTRGFNDDQLLASISGAKVITSSKCKRQRTGPSCDVCRSKKIKCDATVLVISQDPSLLFNCKEDESLHCPLSIDTCRPDILTKIPTEVRKQLAEHKDMSLVRHVDKLIAFSSCSSCQKKKDRDCSFSKGFTRNDIAVFSTLNKKLGKRNSLGDFTVKDYLNVGYSLD
ncbi:Sut1/Sut2 [Kluyveromyces lactis]|nr:Sut1/Sut2 [Kluyveromyces lactis]